MKINTPEKIYLQQNTTTDCYEEWWPEWFEARTKDTDIEYIRKDVFIKKANMWIEKNIKKWYENIKSHGFRGMTPLMIIEFKNYIEGE